MMNAPARVWLWIWIVSAAAWLAYLAWRSITVLTHQMVGPLG